MEQYSEAYVGLDVSTSRNAVAVANGGREGEVRYLGEIDNSLEATRKLVAKLSAKYDQLHFCYEAGPTGYGLRRWLTGLGHRGENADGCILNDQPGQGVTGSIIGGFRARHSCPVLSNISSGPLSHCSVSRAGAAPISLRRSSSVISCAWYWLPTTCGVRSTSNSVRLSELFVVENSFPRYGIS